MKSMVKKKSIVLKTSQLESRSSRWLKRRIGWSRGTLDKDRATIQNSQSHSFHGLLSTISAIKHEIGGDFSGLNPVSLAYMKRKSPDGLSRP